MLDGSILHLLYLIGGIISFFILIGIGTLILILIKKLRREYLATRQIETNYVII